MNPEERVISIVKRGDTGDGETDRISLEFSPSELKTLGSHFRDQALKANSYAEQTAMRDLYGSFSRARNMWHRTWVR